METATLTSPPRPVMVQPIQKSLSLPSYARAGGEGIDHKLIFAALEQREKVRRKSKIFKDKEKTGSTRQNYFCLPLPSGNKCRETSLSSDTSCSSLEFQKPKVSSSPPKATKIPHHEQNGVKDNHTLSPEPNAKTDVNNNSDEGKNVPNDVPVKKECVNKEKPRVDTPRSTLGSSDSMERTERSSKSSNDSLSKKERLVAIKARVEAERERKLCDSSTDEEETTLRITRHNSDGVIHRTVREVKSKSTRGDKRFRRRTPEESAARRNSRKQHRSLYIPSSVDLDSSKPPIIRSGSSYSLQKDLDSLTKDFLFVENKFKGLQQIAKDNYFSDICSGSYRSRFVKPIVDEIEAKEHKQRFNRDSALNRSVLGTRSRKGTVSPNDQLFDSSSHSNFSSMESKQSRFPLNSQQKPDRSCVSPAFRAPTPPPRSPKSMEFVNQVLLQHQNASSNSAHYYNEACSLERNKNFRTNTLSQSSVHSSSLDQIKRDLLNCRKKFGNNVPLEDEKSSEKSNAASFQHQSKVLTHHFPPRSPDLSQRLSGSPRKLKLLDFPTSKVPSIPTDPGKRWEKLEVDSEKAFNSIESKAKSSDIEWRRCRLFPFSKLNSCSYKTPMTCDYNNKDVTREGFSLESLVGQSPVEESMSSPKSPKESMNPFGSLSKTFISSSPESKRSILARLRRHDENKTNISLQNVGDVKENLTNAMEELENVYRSLRMSNENLSSEKPKPINLSETHNNSYSTNHHQVGNTDLFNGYANAKKSSYPVEDIKRSVKENLQQEPQTKFQTNSKTEKSIKDALCIDELFGDLTLQLDMEQKLLEEMRHKKSTHSPAQRKKSLEPQSPSESFKPEHLESIDKSCSSAVKDAPDFQSQEVCAISNIKQRVLAKKKHKAVRSLSANIASIMQSDPLVATQSRTRESENRTPPIINPGDKPALLMSRTSPELSAEPPRASSENSREERIPHRDEIWQVRVSMDPGKGPEAPPLPSETSTFSRLHSVLRRQNENIVRRDEPIPSSKQQSPPPPVLLNESELEKLLTTLLKDVSNKPLHDKRFPSLSANDNESIFTKGTLGYVRKRLLAQNMDPGLTSQNRTANEKQLAELLPSASGLSGNGSLDNNSNQNNNDAEDVHCPSLLPSRDRFSPGYRVSDDNRSLASHRNSACVENLYNPRTSWLSSRGSGRRHSIGLDDFSNLSMCRGYRNFNQQLTRPPAFHHSPVSHCSSDTAANSSSAVDRCKLICQSELEFTERQNQNQARDIDLSVKSTCNGRSFSATNFIPAHSHEKFKDKSFVRKSSLNRLDFVEQVSHATAHNSQVPPCNHQSSSEANSDHDRSWSQASVSSSLAKRKSTLGNRTEKEVCVGLTRQDAVPEAASGGIRKGSWFSRHREGSLKLRNRKSPSALASHIKKKSLSAGEQDSFSDFVENAGGNKVCFSAQEINPQELLQDHKPVESSPLSHRRNSPKPSISKEPNGQDLLNKGSQTTTSISTTCDTSSHVSGEEQLPKEDAGVEAVSQTVHCHEQEGACPNEKDVCSTEHLDIDQDLFDSHDSTVSSPLHRFPIDDADDLTLDENNELSNSIHPNTACNQPNAAGESPSEVGLDGIESLSIKSVMLESDRESAKQPSSILRKKSSEERREIHGILKNAEDKAASRLLPSILKHRESSEEKDVWTQSDLHSILKKSTSEEDSSNNSPDIRPILKNTSTDDESSGMSSKPKPILKKRTSFSEECSYACFHSGELKPILKKKSIIDTCEEQPKPILKTRRKSEEAAATTSEFAIGSRPRAYSADRGVMKANEKKPSDDLS